MKSKKSIYKLIVVVLSITLITTTIVTATGMNDKVWIRTNANSINSLTSNNYDDLKFLDPILKNKSVVCLGENFHRVAEYSSMKTRLIKYLHEKLGFDVIAFEAPLGDCEAVNSAVSQMTSAKAMEGAIFPIWYSKETLGLFDYIKAQNKSSKPLYLTGYDMQLNSMAFTNYMFSLINKIDPEYAKEYADFEIKYFQDSYAVINKYGEDSYKHSDELKVVENKYGPMYQKLLDFIDQHEKEIQSYEANNHHLIEFIKRVISQKITFIQMVMYDTKASYEFRDKIMVNNVEWLMKTMYPGKKVILWAHNDHLSKNTSQILVKDNGKWVNTFSSMGESLNKKLGDKEYVIGFYMNKGKACTITTQKMFTIPKMPKGSLEELMIQSGYKNTFLDLTKFKTKDKKNEWVFNPICAAEDGMTSEIIEANAMKFIPKQQYDGIIMIDKVNAPTVNY